MRNLVKSYLAYRLTRSAARSSWSRFGMVVTLPILAYMTWRKYRRAF